MKAGEELPEEKMLIPMSKELKIVLLKSLKNDVLDLRELSKVVGEEKIPTRYIITGMKITG